MGWMGNLDSLLMSKGSESDSQLVLLVKPAGNSRPVLEGLANMKLNFSDERGSKAVFMKHMAH